MLLVVLPFSLEDSSIYVQVAAMPMLSALVELPVMNVTCSIVEATVSEDTQSKAKNISKTRQLNTVL